MTALTADEKQALIAFSREIIRGAWEGGMGDYAIEDAAERHGLIVPTRNLNSDDESFVFADWLRDPRETT